MDYKFSTRIGILSKSLITGILAAWVQLRGPRMKHGEILSTEAMKAKYNLTADRYHPPQLDPGNVPEHLRNLVPLAAKWGIGDDIIRQDFQQKASEEEEQELQDALTGRGEAINEWLDSFSYSGKQMSEEAIAFMYMMLSVEEMGMGID